MGQACCASRYRDRFGGGFAKALCCSKNHFILSRIDARNGALGLVPDGLDGAIVTNDFPVYEIDQKKLFPLYIDWLCKTTSFWEECQRASEGTTNRVRLKEERFLSLEIPLPPLAEQQRIVARIEDLAEKVNEARTLRQLANKDLKYFRSASLLICFQNCGTETVELQDVCESIIDNLHSNPRYSETGVPCVRSPDVAWGTLHLASALRTDEHEYNRRTARGEPRSNDIVFVREGGGTGKVALVSEGQRFSLGQRVMMLRPDRQKILPRFFLYQLLSPLVQVYQVLALCKGSASPHLNIGVLRRLQIRLPSIADQHQIVTHLDSLQKQINELERLHYKTASHLNALLPSILDKAFTGELS